MPETPKTPTLPTRVSAIELSEYNAPRVCKVCRDPADWYVYVTAEMAEEITGLEFGDGEWPVNVMLCDEHFREAPRVESLEDHPAV